MRSPAGRLLWSLLLWPAALGAQETEMQDMVMKGPHITLTPHRAEREGDRARADSVVAIARAAVERYQDVSVAEADGYQRFAPRVRQQRVYHYTSRKAAFRARTVWDPAKPTALLYQDDPAGGLRLIGVMYTAPADTPLDELDRRIPLSIAPWHQHTNICLPPRGEDEAAAIMGRHPRFGGRGSIATEEACRAAGGRWRSRMFNWMVHVNVFASTPDGVWAHDPGGMRHH
jgi:hypothetical protein